MKAVIQRVTESAVRIGDETVGQIGPGLIVLLGIGQKDRPADADWLAEKICHLRIFEDNGGKIFLCECRITVCHRTLQDAGVCGTVG